MRGQGPPTQKGVQSLLRRKTRDLTIAIAAAVLASVGPALAQTVPGNAETGRQLAQRLCSTCHVIDADTSAPRQADVPSFPVIAHRPGATAEQLAGRIIIPHPAMPGVPLTAPEIRNLVAYILSLKRTN